MESGLGRFTSREIGHATTQGSSWQAQGKTGPAGQEAKQLPHELEVAWDGNRLVFALESGDASR